MLRKIRGDDLFRYYLLSVSVLVLFVIILVFLELFSNSLLALRIFGIKFFIRNIWDPIKREFSALPFIFGTFYTASLALIVSYIISVLVAYALTEIVPRWIAEYISALVDLIAAIPSVVIGLWGIFYLIPLIRDVIYPALKPLSFIPLFSGATYGFSYLAATLVLIFMITPIQVSIFREAFLSVPRDLKDALYALGATRYEVARHVVIPYSRRAMMAGVILAYGRALGETLAVTMVIGNKPNITLSLLSPGYTLASVIANEFLEATDPLYSSSLIALGLVLMIISLIVNIVGYIIIRRAQR